MQLSQASVVRAISAGVIVLVVGRSGQAAACTKDVDCKGNGVCKDGSCFSPPSAASSMPRLMIVNSPPCGTTADCQGARVCERGQCVDASSAIPANPEVPPGYGAGTQTSAAPVWPTSAWVVAVGVDYRSVTAYFFNPGGSGESVNTQEGFSLFGLAGEVMYRFHVTDRWAIAPGFGLTAMTGTYDGYRTGVPPYTPPITQVVSGSAAFGVRLEILGEISFDLRPRLSVLGRVGAGATELFGSSSGSVSPYDKSIGEGAFNLTLGLGLRYDVRSKMGICLLFQFTPVTVSAWSHYMVTPWAPESQGNSTWALQFRVPFSL